MNSVDKYFFKRFGFREDFDPENRFDLKTKVEYKGKTYTVSTVDLGLDHSFGMGKPLYYETMIFLDDGGKNEFCDFQLRYSTEEEARISHENIVKAFERGEIKWK